MAFCTACGAQVDDASAFCTKCGAKTIPAAPPILGTAATPAKQSNTLKIVLIALGVLLAVGIAVVAGVGFMAKKAYDTTIQTSSDGKETKITIGGTSISTSGDDEKVVASLGIEQYPGAKLRDDSAAEISTGTGSLASAVFETSDGADDVVKFYREKYSKAEVMDMGDTKMLTWKNDAKSGVMVMVSREDEKTTITVQCSTEKNGS
jgi:hypothetical protein